MNFVKKPNQILLYEKEILLGLCEYEEHKNIWNIVHTEVNPSYQGKGLGKILVKEVCKEAHLQNKKVIATCTYAKKVLEKSENHVKV